MLTEIEILFIKNQQILNSHENNKLALKTKAFLKNTNSAKTTQKNLLLKLSFRNWIKAQEQRSLCEDKQKTE